MRRLVAIFAVLGTTGPTGIIVASAAPPSEKGDSFDAEIASHAQALLAEGKKIFRYDTFGSEAFGGDTLELHKAIACAKNGGVGRGVSPKN
jgi:hypothetical protein